MLLIVGGGATVALITWISSAFESIVKSGTTAGAGLPDSSASAERTMALGVFTVGRIVMAMTTITAITAKMTRGP